MRDLHNNIKASRATSPAAAITGNSTTDSQIIDTQGFESVEFVSAYGVITDGTFTPSLQEGDAANLSDAATVAAGDMLGTVAAATAVATTDNNTVKKLGYKGTKRYVRQRLTQSGATTGGFVAVVAVQGHARNNPGGGAPSP
jgi:hypothetical protein